MRLLRLMTLLRCNVDVDVGSGSGSVAVASVVACAIVAVVASGCCCPCSYVGGVPDVAVEVRREDGPPPGAPVVGVAAVSAVGAARP